jgi:flagellar assembly protein FliH
MGLIKSNAAPVSLAPFSMRDIEAHAKTIILRAKQQADQILAAAQTEGVDIRQKAYDQGFVAGREDGMKKGTEDGRAAGKQAALAEQKAKLEQLLKTFNAAVVELNASRSKLESAASSEVIKLAIAIARRVTKLQGQADPKVLTENIKAAMRLVVHSTDIKIAVHPSQKQSLTETLPQLRMQWPNVTHVELVEDPKLAPGGCRIFTAAGEIDGDLDDQINRVAADLLPGGAIA